MHPRFVEVLHVAACPHAQDAIERVHDAAAALGVAVDVCRVLVETEQDAVRLHFLGSPTVHVNGRDVDPEAANRHDYSLQCRMYPDAGGLTGAPPAGLILAALRAG